ncbi:MAG: outer membrane beta-barrel protein [Bacteroidota bacterium]
MKKAIVIVSLLFVASFTEVKAQDKNVGGIFGFGTEIETPALGVNGEYFVTSNIAIAPSFIYYFPNSNNGFLGTEITVTWWELNANANFYFAEEGIAEFYGIGGINYTNARVKIESPSNGESTTSNGEIGLNIGAGANFDINQNFKLFAELKYVIGDADQLGIFVGARFPLN